MWMSKGGTEGRDGNMERTSSAEGEYLSNALNNFSNYFASWKSNSCLKLLSITTIHIPITELQENVCESSTFLFMQPKYKLRKKDA